MPQQDITNLIAQSLVLLCKSTLKYNHNVSIDGVLSITVDGSRVQTFDIKEKLIKNVIGSDDSFVVTSSDSSCSGSRALTKKRQLPEHGAGDVSKKKKLTVQEAEALEVSQNLLQTLKNSFERDVPPDIRDLIETNDYASDDCLMTASSASDNVISVQNGVAYLSMVNIKSGGVPVRLNENSGCFEVYARETSPVSRLPEAAVAPTAEVSVLDNRYIRLQPTTKAAQSTHELKEVTLTEVPKMCADTKPPSLSSPSLAAASSQTSRVFRISSKPDTRQNTSVAEAAKSPKLSGNLNAVQFDTADLHIVHEYRSGPDNTDDMDEDTTTAVSASPTTAGRGSSKTIKRGRGRPRLSRSRAAAVTQKTKRLRKLDYVVRQTGLMIVLVVASAFINTPAIGGINNQRPLALTYSQYRVCVCKCTCILCNYRSLLLIVNILEIAVVHRTQGRRQRIRRRA